MSNLSNGCFAPTEIVQTNVVPVKRSVTPAMPDVPVSHSVPKEEEKRVICTYDGVSVPVSFDRGVPCVYITDSSFDCDTFRILGEDVYMYETVGKTKKFVKIKEKTEELWSLKIEPEGTEFLLYINHP